MSQLLIDDNVVLLRSAIDLLCKLDDEKYAMKQVKGEKAGIGPHLRHVLDHYQCFLRGLQGSYIDYDQRLRLDEQETFCGAAIEFMSDLILELDEAKQYVVDHPLTVRMDCGTNYACAEEATCHSSFGRELQFLVSHTVHHFAIIAIYCVEMKIEVPEGFGYAPSTLKYQSCEIDH